MVGKILIGKQVFDLSDEIRSGGEGTIYKLSGSVAAKVYFQNRLDDELRKKVLALCNSYDSNIKGAPDHKYAFPQEPGYHSKVAFSDVTGFSMELFDSFCPILDLAYDLEDQSYQRSAYG